MEEKLKPTLAIQNNFKIRLLSLRKVDNHQITLSDKKINLIWFYKNKGELKNLDRRIKSEFRDKINLIKCQKIQSFLSLNIVNKNQMCLILLNIQYEKSLLKCLQDYKITYLIYNQNIQNVVDYFKSSKVYFMTQKEQMLYEYIKDYINRVNKVPISRQDAQKINQEKLNHEIKKHLQMNGQQKGKIRFLPRISKTPKKQSQTKQHFLNSNYLNPGPGQYQISISSNGKYSRKTNYRQISPKITEVAKFHQIDIQPFKIRLES